MPSDHFGAQGRPSSGENGYAHGRPPHHHQSPQPPLRYPWPQRRVLNRLTAGEPLFSAHPFAEGAGAHLRTLFAFATAPSEGSKRSAFEQQGMGIAVPLELKKDFGRAAENVTAVLARYIAAHVELSLSPGSDALGGYGPEPEGQAREEVLKRRAAALDDYRSSQALMLGRGRAWRRQQVFFSSAPLEDRRAGRRLRELFQFVCGPRRTQARRDLEKENVGLRIPLPLHAAFKHVVDQQRPTETEVLIRYMAAHVHLSDRWT